MADITARNLVNYELTEVGKKTERIFLPQNRQGDRHLNFPTSNMTDYLAEELVNRKDGRGEKYVRLKARSNASAKKTTS